MASLVQSGNCGATNTPYYTTIGYYVIQFVSEEYTIQEDTNCDGKVSTSDELVVKEHYLSSTQENKKRYW